jgi:hypothetical protein
MGELRMVFSDRTKEETMKKHLDAACSLLSVMRPELKEKIETYGHDIAVKFNPKEKSEVIDLLCPLVNTLDTLFHTRNDDSLGLTIVSISQYEEDIVAAFVHELSHIFLDYSDNEACMVQREVVFKLFGGSARLSNERIKYCLTAPLGEWLEQRRRLASPENQKRWYEKPSKNGHLFLDVLISPMNKESYNALCDKRCVPRPKWI